jgi:hypothetical protein
MRAHLDVLGWLWIIWGAFAVLSGSSLLVLAAGSVVAGFERRAAGAVAPAVVLLGLGGLLLVAGGVALIVTGRGVLARAVNGRLAALVLAVPNLLIVPFGTALGAYTLWALLNDDGRRAFGRPPRSSAPR